MCLRGPYSPKLPCDTDENQGKPSILLILVSYFNCSQFQTELLWWMDIRCGSIFHYWYTLYTWLQLGWNGTELDISIRLTSYHSGRSPSNAGYWIIRGFLIRIRIVTGDTSKWQSFTRTWFINRCQFRLLTLGVSLHQNIKESQIALDC